MLLTRIIMVLLLAASALAAENPQVALYPRSLTVQAGTSQRFIGIAILVPNDTDNSVSWYVNDVPGGNAALGTIDAEGRYTAPATVPANPDVTIKAIANYDKKAANTAAVHIAPRVTLDHPSFYLYPGETLALHATVTGGVHRGSVKWLVNDIEGGNEKLGRIDRNGTYRAPATVPPPGWLWIKAVSDADPKGVAYGYIKLYPAKMMKIVPGAVSILPGSSVHFYRYTNVYPPVTHPTWNRLVRWAVEKINGKEMAHWAVDNVEGGNSSTGTIDAFGTYTAPPTPGTHSITAVSQVDHAYSAGATITVTTNPGASRAGWLPPYYRPRPYDIYPVSDSITLYAARGQTVGAHILITANGEDLSGVDVQQYAISNLSGTVSLEGMIDSVIPSQAQPLGEYPDPLFPKVDAIYKQRRTVQWPLSGFRVNRVSPGYIRPWYADNAGRMSTYAKGTQLTNLTLQCAVGAAERRSGVVSLSLRACGNGEEAMPYAGQKITVSGVAAGRSGTAFNGTFAICGPPDDGCKPPTTERLSYRQSGVDDSASGGEVTALRGFGWMTSSGTYTGKSLARYSVRIDGSGSRATARFRWSRDGGRTWVATGVPTAHCPCVLSDGVAVDFAEDVAHFQTALSFNAGDDFEVWAGPFRIQPVWADFYIPPNQAPGTYKGKVAVTYTGSSSGPHSTTLNVTVVVLDLTVPVNPSVKAYIPYVSGAAVNFAVLGVSNQDPTLPNIESAIFQLNRLSSPVFSCQYNPQYTFNTEGTVLLTSDYTKRDSCFLPALQGRVAPHGEKASVFANTHRYFTNKMTTPTLYFLSVKDEMVHYQRLGLYGDMFDFTKDEPSNANDITNALQHSTLSRAAAQANGFPEYKTLVTSSLRKTRDWVGNITVMAPIEDALDPMLGYGDLNDKYDAARGQHQLMKELGAEIWFYDSCQELGCGGPGEGDNTYGYPVQGAFDEEGTFPFLLGIEGAMLEADGYLYYAPDQAEFYAKMPQPKLDYFTDSHWFSSNGGGGMAYPGRTTCTISPNCVSIGGDKPIILESLRMKHVRDGFFLWEIINRCRDRSACLAPLMKQYQDGHTWNPDPAVWAEVVREVMKAAEGQPAGKPPAAR